MQEQVNLQSQKHITLQNLIRTNPFSQQFANKKIKQIKKHCYRKNQIFNQYFNIVSNLKIINNAAIFHSQAIIYQKSKLSKQKQSMYSRSIINNAIPDCLLDQLLQDNRKQKGFVKNRRNRSVVVKNKFVYVQKWSIFQLDLTQIDSYDNISNKKFKKIKLCQFYGDQILGIKQYKTKAIQGCNIIIRFTRKVIIFNLESRKIIHQVDSQGQFIEIQHNRITNQLEALQFLNTGQTRLLTLNQQQNTQKHVFSELMHSIILSKNNQRILSNYQKIMLFDLRKKKQQVLYDVKSITKERIYNFIHLKGQVSYSPYLAVAQAQSINFFDLRKMKNPISSVYHMCEIAPPFILQYNDKELTTKNIDDQKEIHPFLLCFNPYQLGASLILNIDKQTLTNESDASKLKYFKILPDLQFNNHNDSINYIVDQKEKLVKVFSVNKEGSLVYQKLIYDRQSNHYKFDKGQSNYPICETFSKTNSILTWIQSQFVEKYIVAEDSKYNFNNSQDEQEKCEYQNEEYQKQQEKENQKQQEKQEYLKGEENNKKMNYANLRKFHHQIQRKSKLEVNFSQQQRDQIFPNSLNSTLGSLNVNQLQSNEDNYAQQLNPLSMFKENIINYNNFFNLKSQWEN